LITGRIQCFFPDRGYGFVESPDLPRAVFVHISDANASGVSSLTPGDTISFICETDIRTGKIRAVDISRA
jgi:cold shock CspA family protein